uniref:Uncharacterized protein n=1 Tax=Anguilla anguilla TaxID=7936 RepID=A0A0E9VY32_ANGAN
MLFSPPVQKHYIQVCLVLISTVIHRPKINPALFR